MNLVRLAIGRTVHLPIAVARQRVNETRQAAFAVLCFVVINDIVGTAEPSIIAGKQHGAAAIGAYNKASGNPQPTLLRKWRFCN